MPRVSVTEAEAMMRDDIRAMRKEYTRMRDIAQKRIGRLEKTEFSETSTYQTNREGFKKLKELDPRDFAKAFSELSKFVSASGSTIKGQRETKRKTTERLNESIGNRDEQGNPVSPVNPGNYWRVIKILNEARRQKVVYGSDKMVELADATLELTNDQFDVILENLEKSLQHSDTVGDSISEYMEKNDVQGFQVVDMDDFIRSIGW